MTRQSIQKLSRRWHRFLGPLIGVQLLLWTLGGIYFSWFHLDNVHGDYERAGQAIPDLRKVPIAVSIEALLAGSELHRVEDVRLGTFLGRPVIRLYQDHDRVEMYDAASGDKLSPISEDGARAVAEADFGPPGEIVSVQFVDGKEGEYKNAVPAYRVRFDNWKRTHLYVHANTGEVTARRNAIWRGFDFLWMLHILDFRERENFNNWLLRILSLLSLITIATGYLLWLATTPRLWRRSGGRGQLVVLGGLMLFTISCMDGGEKPTVRAPNFIVIMADDVGAGDFGSYGHPQNPTPNLSELARTGVQFSTCYATPVCRPTRIEIMTGQYGHHNGVYQFASQPGGPPPGSPVNDIKHHLTFAQVLKERGYATAQAGKWQLSGRHPTLIREAGFDEYCMFAYDRNLPPGVEHTGGWESGGGESKTSRYWHPAIVRNGEYVPSDPGSYGPDIFTDFVIDFARRHRDRPFFIYYPMVLTHVPYVPTPDTLRSDADRFNSSAGALGPNVRYIDKLVGRIVSALDDLNLRENTIVFFTSDNGNIHIGKGRATELGARVPMIVNGPTLVEPLYISRDLIDLSDVLPTLVEFAGADLPRGHVIDGRSFAPILRGEKGDRRDWIYSYIGNRRIVRTRRWLLEDNTPQSFGRLYDCDDHRDGSGCREVTDSEDSEVMAARRMMIEILADKPVPEIDQGH